VQYVFSYQGATDSLATLHVKQTGQRLLSKRFVRKKLETLRSLHFGIEVSIARQYARTDSVEEFENVSAT